MKGRSSWLGIFLDLKVDSVFWSVNSGKYKHKLHPSNNKMFLSNRYSTSRVKKLKKIRFVYHELKQKQKEKGKSGCSQKKYFDKTKKRMDQVNIYSLNT